MPTNDPVLSTADLMTLVETGRELATQVSFASLLERILEKATLLTDSADGSLILFHERRRQLYFAHATGPSAAMLLARWGEASDQGIPVEGSKAGEVFTTGRPLIVQAVREDPNHFAGVDEDTGRDTSSMVCVPLAVADRALGVVQILNKRGGDYTRRDLVLLEHFAAQAAVALRNARMFEDLVAHMGLYGAVEPGEGPGPIELLEELNRPARNERLTILFADLRGFTQLCNVESRPERIQQYLNDLLSMLTDEVLAQRGMVNKFTGDGLMALFRGPDHASRAVRGAAGMLQRFDALKGRWDAASNSPLKFLDLGIGLATDTVLLGSIGSDRVRDFTAVGTAVNLAAALMERARGGRRMIVDKMTFRDATDIVEAFDGPESFELRGPDQTLGLPYECYHVRGLKGQAAAPSRPAPAPPAASVARRDVFVSYSHKDKPWLEKIQVHLKPYLRGGSVSAWDDTRIRAGAAWRDEIRAGLDRAGVALLLVSPHFLDSDFIATRELPPLLAAARKGGLRVLWVPVSASSYEETEIGTWQAAHSPSRPLDSLTPPEQNQALVEICKKIKAAAGEAGRAAPGPAAGC